MRPWSQPLKHLPQAQTVSQLLPGSHIPGNLYRTIRHDRSYHRCTYPQVIVSRIIKALASLLSFLPAAGHTITARYYHHTSRIVFNQPLELRPLFRQPIHLATSAPVSPLQCPQAKAAMNTSHRTVLTARWSQSLNHAPPVLLLRLVQHHQ